MTDAPERRGASRRREDHERDRLFELTQDLLAVASLDGAIRQANPSFEKTTGWSQDELKARAIVDFVHNDEAGFVRAAFERLKNGGGAITFEARFQCQDDRSLWLAWSATPDSANDAIYITAHNIMGRKLAEAESARFGAVVKSSNDAIVSASLHGTVQSWNPAAERIFGYKASEAIGKPLSMLEPRQSGIGRSSKAIDPAQLTDAVANEIVQRKRKDGMLITVAMTMSPVKDAAGHLVAYSMIAREVNRDTA